MINQIKDSFKHNIYIGLGSIPLIILLFQLFLENLLWILYTFPGYLILIIYILPVIGVGSLLLSIIINFHHRNMGKLVLAFLLIIYTMTPVLNVTYRPSSLKVINFNAQVYLFVIDDLISDYNHVKYGDDPFRLERTTQVENKNDFNFLHQ